MATNKEKHEYASIKNAMYEEAVALYYAKRNGEAIQAVESGKVDKAQLSLDSLLLSNHDKSISHNTQNTKSEIHSSSSE
jgi:hypothetical protein